MAASSLRNALLHKMIVAAINDCCQRCRDNFTPAAGFTPGFGGAMLNDPDLQAKFRSQPESKIEIPLVVVYFPDGKISMRSYGTEEDSHTHLSDPHSIQLIKEEIRSRLHTILDTLGPAQR